jgi:hypothetical protein
MSAAGDAVVPNRVDLTSSKSISGPASAAPKVRVRPF